MVFTDPLEPYLAVSESANTSAWSVAYYDSGYQMGPYSTGATWSIDNPDAASLSDSGHNATLTGDDVDADPGPDVTTAGH